MRTDFWPAGSNTRMRVRNRVAWRNRLIRPSTLLQGGTQLIGLLTVASKQIFQAGIRYASWFLQVVPDL